MFFPCRIQASATPVHAGCDPVVEAFLGWTIKRSETILRFNRNQHGRIETYPFIEETFGHQIKKESEEQTLYRGKSMVTQSNSRRRYKAEILPIRRKTLYNQSINQSKEVVNSGDWWNIQSLKM